MEKDQAALTPENLQTLIMRYKHDIALFGIEVLGFERFDPWQLELFKAILDPKQKKIAIAAAHSVGKTLTACVIVLHRVLCYYEARSLLLLLKHSSKPLSRRLSLQ